MKICLVEAELFHTEEIKHRQTGEAVSRLSHFHKRV
jgi:hypothetical protein